jgi:hypothetical protein
LCKRSIAEEIRRWTFPRSAVVSEAMRFALVAAAALVFAAGVWADGGPSPPAVQGWDGVVAPDGKSRYVALPARRGTVVARVSTRGGRVLQWGWLGGGWGIPQVTWDGATGGVSRDGRTLVLATSEFSGGLRVTSRFPVLNTKTLRLRKTVRLNGDYAFDALSPDGRMLYLIHHVSQLDLTRYTVVAYDLGFDRLVRRVVDDRRRDEWSMSGLPLARATTSDGGWAYTLYQGSGRKKPFVHALDTRHAKAVCIDIPWRGRQDALWKIRLALRPNRLLLRKGGKTVLVVDTRTYRVSRG